MVAKHSLSCESFGGHGVKIGSKMATLRSAERSVQEAELFD